MESSYKAIIFIVTLINLLDLSVQECDLDYYRSEDGAFVDNIVCIGVKNLNLELLHDEFYPYKYSLGYHYFDNVMIINSKFPKFGKQEMQDPMLFHTLTISNCEIDTIESKTFESIGVMHLNLESNGIRHLNPSPFSSETILSLNLSHNSLTVINEDVFEKMTNLKILDLSQNNITTIGGFSDLISLEKLDLSFNKNLQTDFFYHLKSMPQLCVLGLSFCNLDQISKKSLSNLRSLEMIDLEGNNFKTLRGEDFPVSLRVLYVRDSNIFSLKGSWEHLTKLIKLDLNNNFLTDMSMLKNVLGQLRHLLVLKLSNNTLKEFDCNVISYNKELQLLSIADNSLQQLLNIEKCPKSIAYLFIKNNDFSNVEAFSYFRNLKSLDLSKNKLETITYDTFRGLDKLQYLNVTNNKLTSLEIGCFRDLSSLSKLDLSHNFIVNLDHGTFTGLRYLTELNLAYNQLEDVDEEVFHTLKYLTEFDVSWNKLDSFNVAKALTHIRHNVVVNLYGNKYTCSTLMKMLASSEYIYGDIFNESNINGIRCDNEFINKRQEL